MVPVKARANILFSYFYLNIYFQVCGVHLLEFVETQFVIQVDEYIMASGGDQTKRRKPAEGDSPDKYEQLLSKSTEVFGHCNKRCTEKGEAVQCDLCYSWVHASCEGIKRDNYRPLLQITTNIEGLVQCALCFKQFQSEWVLNSFKVNGSTRLHYLNL